MREETYLLWGLEQGGPRNTTPFQTARQAIHTLPVGWQLASGSILTGRLRYSGPSWLRGVLLEAAVAP